MTMNILKVFGAEKTMTSREVSEVTGKSHSNVLRDIDTLTQNSDLNTGFKSDTYTSGDPPREYRQVIMTADAVLLLITGYSAVLRAKVIQYMRSLEAQINKPATKLSPMEAMFAAIQGVGVALQDHEERLKLLEATSGGQDQYISIKGWWRLNRDGLPLTEGMAAVMGKKAAKHCQRFGITMGAVADARYGKVNTYPRDVADELFSNDE